MSCAKVQVLVKFQACAVIRGHHFVLIVLVHVTMETNFSEFYIIAERLSARQLIVQCGLKSQLAYIYIYVRNFRHA